MKEIFASSAIGVFSYFLMKRYRKIPEVKRAICVLNNFGTVRFTKITENHTRIECDLACGDTVKPGLHGIHVHKSGDLSRGCESTCSHYNPDGNVHGDATGKKRHRGDLGNILVSDNGTCNDTFVANVNVYEIIGRGLILHDDQDDLGKGENEESLKTGNAGKRIACGVIGLLE